MARRLELINRDLTNLLKSIITQKDLIDTGLLRNTIKCEFDEDLNINVDAQDYFKYLDEPYNVIEDFMNTLEFDTLYDEAIEYKIEQELN